MAITKKQLIDLGFKYGKRSKMSQKKYDTLIYYLNKTDYIYLGFNSITNRIDFKRLWKTFFNPETNDVLTYPLDRMGELSFNYLKEFLERETEVAINREKYYEGK